VGHLNLPFRTSANVVRSISPDANGRHRLRYGPGVPNERARSSFFYDLVDDAAMFPPRNAPAGAAVAAHHALRRGPFADFVGPLLVAAGRLGELATIGRSPAVDVVGIGRPAGALRPGDGFSLVGREQVWDGSPPDPADIGCRLALEPAALDAVEDLLAAVGEVRIDGAPVIAKFRAGGVSASDFPSDADLAYCLYAAYNAGVPFKLTAGLHHAVRHTGAETGFEHHGFLNVMVAVARCHDGAGEADIAETLAVRDAGTLADQVCSWTEAEGIAVRSMFLSFGCCDVDDPVSDLLALGLIEAGSDRTEGEPPR
jgi:hypothetical protein